MVLLEFWWEVVSHGYVRWTFPTTVRPLAYLETMGRTDMSDKQSGFQTPQHYIGHITGSVPIMQWRTMSAFLTMAKKVDIIH